MAVLTGYGSIDFALNEKEIYNICKDALSQIDVESKKILVLMPDNTRDAPIGMFFKIIYDIIGKKVNKLDYLVATGTHISMTTDQIYKYLSIDSELHQTKYRNVEFFSHEFDNPEALTTLGKISAEEIREISGGLFCEDINIPVNKMIFEYDHIFMITPIVPHEAMGYAGGNKYFFPGISSVEFIQTFHWIAATIGTQNIIGVVDTPPRRLINKAAEFLKMPRTCFSFVIDEKRDLVCLFAGDPIESWSEAVTYSEKIHITYVDRAYKQVLALLPDMYEDLWVGSKAMYKLDSIIADGGELIIYGPKMREISFVHNEAINRIGYHVPEYFLKQWDLFKNESKLIMAHSINVCGSGTFEHGIEKPRIKVTLATAIDQKTCEKLNLGYMDYKQINPEEWKNRSDDILIVEHAGQALYRIKKTINNFD